MLRFFRNSMLCDIPHIILYHTVQHHTHRTPHKTTKYHTIPLSTTKYHTPHHIIQHTIPSNIIRHANYTKHTTQNTTHHIIPKNATTQYIILYKTHVTKYNTPPCAMPYNTTLHHTAQAHHIVKPHTARNTTTLYIQHIVRDITGTPTILAAIAQMLSAHRASLKRIGRNIQNGQVRP